MNDELQRKYKKCKYVAKMWEKDFQKKHGIIPSKYDIHDAPRKIREAYKLYYHLKKSLLDDTSSDIVSEDGFDPTLEISQDVSNASQSTLSLPDLSQPSNVWGDEVSNKKHNEQNQKKEAVPIRQASSGIDTAKLFAGFTFAKRNPRKSLPRTTSMPAKSMSDLSSDIGQSPMLDLEAILIAKSTKHTKEMKSTPNLTKSKSIAGSLDKGWLSRHFSDSSLCGFDTTETSASTSTKYGLSNINIGALQQFCSSSSLASPVVSPTNENKLTSTNSSPLNCSISQPSTKESTTSPPISDAIDIQKGNQQLINGNHENDSDSVVENSEDESPKRRFEIIRPTLKRRKVEIENDKLNNSSDVPESTKKTEVISIATKTETLEDTADAKANETLDNVKKPKAKRPAKETSESKVKSNVKKRRAVIVKDNSDDTEAGSSDEYKPTKKPSTKSRLRKTLKTGKSIGAKTRRIKKKNTSTGKEFETEPVEEPEEETTPDYVDFAVDSALTSLPRININELAEAEHVVKKFIYNIKDDNELPSITKNKPEALLKEISSRDNLEAKIKSGRANENYVRINLRKKVFVRGRKNMNYSKYKKNLWKQKKEAALCGPEMDMRGCDGGILKCFKCGMPGHFAQKCPMKGDNLLPLQSTQEDESPFPTLNEAEEMAKERALLVHSTNLENLPVTSNTMIYKDNGCQSEKENIGDASTDENESNHSYPSEGKDCLTHENRLPVTPAPKTYIGHKVPEEFLEKAGLLEKNKSDDARGPIYDLQSDGTVMEPTKEVLDLLKMFGHRSFRKGQDKAIMRILSGISTLVTLSTGSGKSLCYQLPAYLYSKKKKCITLVVSPLVSLMEDQVHGVPVFLNAQCLHTNQTPVQRQNVLEMINKGQVDVLLVSPEAIVAGERSTGFGSILRNLPPIAFACIDEIHCVSQWSHNFRPSYLMICKVLRTKLGVRTILGLTATATSQTRKSIIKHLNIVDGVNGIISDIPLPDNLFLSVSKDEHRDYALVELLRSPRFLQCQSIIVYCTRRDECERVAGFIRTYLQDLKPSGSNVGKRKRINWCAEPYHAGMPASRRRTVQKAFMQNELRIVVATVAFGMGINKADIRAVVHYNMPKTFESYVQEVGRAGRDGLPAQCHLFLDSKGSDQSELRRHIYANSIDRHVIRKLLEKVFVPCSCDKNIQKKEFVDEYAKEIEAVKSIDWEEDFFAETKTKKKRVCPGHEIGISVEKTVQELDIPEENISTLLCYLELDGRWSLKTLSNAYIMCKLISYGGAAQIKKAAKECPPLAMAIALEIKKGTFNETENIFEFSVIEIASAIGWNSGVVKYQLKNLEWTKANGFPRRSTISVSFYELGFRIQSPGDFSNDELDEALDALYNRSVNQERTQLAQLEQTFQGLSSVSYHSFSKCSQTEFSTEYSDQLKSIIREYFQQEISIAATVEDKADSSHDEQIMCDVQSMIHMYPENNFTGRTLARIFHGIQSPNYPALMWSRCKYWRAHFDIDFNHVVKIANAVIIQMRI